MSEKELMYIGGCANGRIILTSDNQYTEIPVIPEFAKESAEQLIESPQADVYSPMRIVAQDHVFKVMRHTGITEADVIRLLIEHYQPLVLRYK